MSEENVEIVRWLIESNHSPDLADRLEEGLDRWAPDCVFVSRLGNVDQEIYHGHEGLRRYASDMTSAWSEWRNEPHEIVEVRQWDAVRVPTGTWRGYEAGPDGLELLVFGAPSLGDDPRGDVEGTREWWTG